MRLASQFQQIALFLHDDRFVASLENMADPAMATVEILGIAAIVLAHTLRALGVRPYVLHFAASPRIALLPG